MAAGRMGHRAKRHRQLIESAGGQVAAVSTTGSGHLRFLVVLPNGATRPLICANTPSDHRAGRNVRAMVRRWCAEAASNDDFATSDHPSAATRHVDAVGCNPILWA